MLRIGGRRYRVVLDVSRRNDFNDRTLGDDSKTLNFQDRQKYLIGLIEGHLGWRNDRHFPADFIVHQETFAGQFTDQVDHLHNIGIAQVERDGTLHCVFPIPPSILCRPPWRGLFGGHLFGCQASRITGLGG